MPRQVHVAGPKECALVLFVDRAKGANHRIVGRVTASTPRAEIDEAALCLTEPDSFCQGPLEVGIHIVIPTGIDPFVVGLANDGHQHHFPENGFVPEAGDFDFQRSVRAFTDVHIAEPKAV